MARNYILEPMEITLSEDYAKIEPPVLDEDSIESCYSLGVIVDIDGNKFAFDESSATEFINGDTSVNFLYHAGHSSVYNSIEVFYETENPTIVIDDGPHTFSIYTETEDPTSNFSKNVTHNDHAYNAVDRIRRKLQAKADDGGIGGGSKDWSVTTTTRTVAENVDGVVTDAAKCQFKVYVNEEPANTLLSKIKLSAETSIQIGDAVEVNKITPKFVYSVSDNGYTYDYSGGVVTYGFSINAIDYDDQGCYIIFVAQPFVAGSTTTMLSASDCTVEYEDTDVEISDDFKKVLQFVIGTSKV